MNLSRKVAREEINKLFKEGKIRIRIVGNSKLVYRKSFFKWKI